MWDGGCRAKASEIVKKDVGKAGMRTKERRGLVGENNRKKTTTRIGRGRKQVLMKAQKSRREQE